MSKQCIKSLGGLIGCSVANVFTEGPLAGYFSSGYNLTTNCTGQLLVFSVTALRAGHIQNPFYLYLHETSDLLVFWICKGTHLRNPFVSIVSVTESMVLCVYTTSYENYLYQPQHPHRTFQQSVSTGHSQTCALTRPTGSSIRLKHRLFLLFTTVLYIYYTACYRHPLKSAALPELDDFAFKIKVNKRNFEKL